VQEQELVLTSTPLKPPHVKRKRWKGEGRGPVPVAQRRARKRRKGVCTGLHLLLSTTLRLITTLKGEEAKEKEVKRLSQTNGEKVKKRVS